MGSEDNVPKALLGQLRGQPVLAGTRVPVLKKRPPRNSEELQGRWVTRGGGGGRHHSA